MGSIWVCLFFVWLWEEIIEKLSVPEGREVEEDTTSTVLASVVKYNSSQILYAFDFPFCDPRISNRYPSKLKSYDQLSPISMFLFFKSTLVGLPSATGCLIHLQHLPITC